MIRQLGSPLYREQASRFIHQKNDQEASLKKANKEVEMNAPLARDKVISPKNFLISRSTRKKASHLAALLHRNN
jgi:hypothetical protein